MHLILLVEDDSTQVFLDTVLPKIAPGRTFEIHSFQGKMNLMKKLGQRLRAYGKWMPEGQRIVVLVDCDSDNCKTLKRELENIAGQSGLVTRTNSKSANGAAGRWQVATQIAIEELEAWYFGDWDSVCIAYPKVLKTIPKKAGYRNPDAIKGGTWEAFERVLQKHHYFETGLRKIEAAKNIGAHIDPARNRSASFKKFCEAVS